MPVGQPITGYLNLTGVALQSTNTYASDDNTIGSMSTSAGASHFSHAMDGLAMIDDLPHSAKNWNPPYGYEDQVRLDANDPQHPADQDRLTLILSTLTLGKTG